ncbi:hypothetical protein QUF61_03290 [Candidatus Venteria ishoeyi]|uniref:Cas10/Cmr2 second palm domain-containing protein n=1 Tax=Candidatus Venteria ishoeyi TaxID=1899563 RepID=UPI0025A64493|nr:hypothetical protein [Candidatus Venteria ishoeyi]MDM8545498.1 hypothetical protein [Candidatus Venteria ishoeyi]
MPTVYGFEIKSIQNYILDGNKLRDMVGASEQIEYICFNTNNTKNLSLIDEVLAVLGINNPQPQFVRKAGGAFLICLDDEEQAQQLQAVWTLAIQRFLPGVSFAQGFASDKTLPKAVEQVRAKLVSNRNIHFPSLPQASPFSFRSPRTGQAAYSSRKRRDQQQEQMDAAITQKHEFYRCTFGSKVYEAGNSRLFKKLAFDVEGDNQDLAKFHWPVDLNAEDADADVENYQQDSFPFLGDNRYVGIIHADGNALGQLLRDLEVNIKAQDLNDKAYKAAFLAFSKAIEDTTLQAIKTTLNKLITRLKLHPDGKDTMPARPLVIGGDDVTFVVRGDLALDFCSDFLQNFERLSQKNLAPLVSEYGIKIKSLTACAGIAFVKANQPFYLAYQLAGKLCDHAKDESKRETSCLAFHRITNSVIGDYKGLLREELSLADKKFLTMQPYKVNKMDASALASLEDLQDFASFMKDEDNHISKGAARELLNLLHLNPIEAEHAFNRWRENMQKSQLQDWEGFIDKLSKLTGSKAMNLSCLFSDDKTPIGDALMLNAVSQGREL